MSYCFLLLYFLLTAHSLLFVLSVPHCHVCLRYALSISHDIHLSSILCCSSSNIGQLSHDVKTIAALVDNIDGGDRLLNAAQNLCVAFSDFLNVAQPDSKQVLPPSLPPSLPLLYLSHCTAFFKGDKPTAVTVSSHPLCLTYVRGSVSD